MFRSTKAPKVTIVIATYATGDRFKALLTSLDALKMSRRDLEVILVDDGSPDGTFGRVQSACRSRRNFSCVGIENSGWPSRPRNVGIDLAKGEYVFFMDHDDHIFPDGLARAVEFAINNDLDFVSTKEVVAGWATPGWSCWRHNVPLVDRLTHEDLQCITPHKLYRRAFLNEHGIRFPEGIKRLEDFNINGQVIEAGARVGLFAEAPVYRWEIGEHNAHKAAYDVDAYWKSFDLTLEAVQRIDDDDLKHQLLARWYRTLVLARLRENFRGGSEAWRTRIWGILRARREAFPEAVDAVMAPGDRLRSIGLRDGSPEYLFELEDVLAGMKIIASETAVAWRDGLLDISFTGIVRRDDGEALPVTRTASGGALVLPPLVAAQLGTSTYGIESDLAKTTVELVIRHRKSNVDWCLPSVGTARVVTRGDREVLEVSASATLDVSRDPFGGALESGIWDVFHRADGLGFSPTSRLAVNGVRDVRLGRENRAFNVYATTAGFLAIDTTGRARVKAERVTANSWRSP